MTNQEGGDSKKAPSKKELKKLAKKAEKDAKKAGGGGGDKQQPPAPPSIPTGPPEFRILHGDASAATLKIAAAAEAYGVTLIPSRGGSAAGGGGLGFLTGPALVTGDGETVFGGNAVCKFLSMIGSSGSGSGSEVGGCIYGPMVDEWLEFEREDLRHALERGKKATRGAPSPSEALATLEGALTGGDGVHLVGDSFTIADTVVVSTIYHAMKAGANVSLPPAVASYVDHHKKSPIFVRAEANAAKLIPPPPPTFDPDDPSLFRAAEFVFGEAIRSAFPSMADADDAVRVARCSNAKHGDYQCNSAMTLFPRLKAAGIPGISKPHDVAGAIIDAVPADNPVLEKFEVNGPGFILCRVKSSYLQLQMQRMIDAGDVIPPKHMKKEKVVVDFSSPNIAKEMHVGHLRSTIIGESICRILEYCGNDVVRMNHVGDWGTQFGMLIQYLKEEFPTFHQDQPNITDLTVFYKNAKGRFDESPEFKKASQLNVVKLQGGDAECLEVWHILCDISRREFQKVYDRLDVTLKEYGESFYNDRIPPVIDEFDKAGLIEIQEGGAKCVFIPKMPVPLMLQKSDGGFGYDSTDMAALKYRMQEVGATRIIIVTDSGQADHFKLCYQAGGMIGWVDEGTHRLEHIGFGTVQGEDGKRFKTRSGETVRLVDLLDEAVHRMESSLKERIEENRAQITIDEVPSVAAALGYGAVKYFDLRRNPTTNYVFSYDRMLDTKGNTAIYLLYAHARLESICAKSKKEHGVDVDDLVKKRAKLILGHPSERNLALSLQLFADTIETTLEDLYPYHICDYLYNASIAASDFVTQCKVLGSPEMESRLLLCRATAIVMRKCFDLLGIRYVTSI